MMAAVTALTRPVAGFLRWWLRELRAAVPGAGEMADGHRARTLDVLVEANQAVLRYAKGTMRRELGRISVDPDAAATARALAARIRRKVRLRRTDVVLCLPHDQALRRRIDLPLAAAENLREVVSFEMERHTSFRAEEVYFDFRLAGIDQETKRLSVNLVAAPRAVVDPAVRLLKDWNLPPDRIATVDSGDCIDYSTNLMPTKGDGGHRRVPRKFVGALALAACGLAGVAVYLEFYQQEQ